MSADTKSWNEAGKFEIEDQNWTPGLTEVSDLPAPPTNNSNWLIPDRLLIGSFPRGNDVDNLVNCGINTFVSLNGEFSFDYYLQSYPNEIDHEKCNFLHFPIADFKTASTSSIVDFIKRLRFLIFKGYKIFLHCAAGHG